MKIECKIRRKGGTEVTLPNDDGTVATINFRPLDATRADSPHVAEVTAEQAQRLFVADARVYVPFDGKAPAAAAKVTKPSDPPPPANTATTNAGDIDGDGTQGGDGEGEGGDGTDGDTNGDGVLSVRELKAGIADGSLDQVKLRELLAAEEASAEPRQSFIAVLVKALK